MKMYLNSKLIKKINNNQLNIKKVLKCYPCMIFFVKNQTKELCNIAVSYNM